jgi:predicted DNA-binding protein
MTLIDAQHAATEADESSTYRRNTVATKLGDDENERLEALALRRKQTTSGLVRELILAEIERDRAHPQADLVLSEIVGVRLLLVNLLQPRDEEDPLTREGFETLLGEIKRMKKQLALEIERESGRR